MELIRKFYMADAPDGGLGGSVKGANKDAETLNESFARVQSTLQDVASTLQKEVGTSILHMIENVEGFDVAAARVARGTLKDLTKELNKASKEAEKTSIAAKGVGAGFMNSKKLQESITALKTTQVSIESKLLSLEMQGVQLSEKEVEHIKQANKAIEEQISLEEKMIDKAERLERAAGKMGDLFKGISKIPILNKLVDSEKVLAAVNKKAAETGSKWQALGAGIKEVFKSIGASLLDPMTYITGIFSLLTKIVEMVIEFNAKTFAIAKDLGVSVNEAHKLQASFLEISVSSKNAGLRSSEMAKTYGEMSRQLGFMAPLSNKFAETAALIQKRTGASAEDMGALAAQSAINGVSLQKTYKTLEASRVVEGAKNKLLLSSKQLMEGIAKTSAAVVINFKGSTKALADAVIRATKLGTTLNQINKQAESLVDFESSIQKEFELQVLTGRDINLTRARELALAGDTKGLMEEMNNQQITYDSFMKENIIQRKAEAEAVGLTVEELSKQLLAQKQANALGADASQSIQERYQQLLGDKKTREEIAELIGKEAEADLNKASMQDKFQAAVEKLQETLASILEGPVKGLIEGFINFISKGENIKKIGNTLKGIFEGIGDVINNWPLYLAKALPYLKAAGAILIGLMSASIISSLSAIPVVGPALGIAAAVAAAASIAALMGVQGPSIAPPVQASTEAMNEPVGPATQAKAESKKAETAKSGEQTTVLHAHVKVGDQGWAKQTMVSLQQSHGTKLQ